MTEMMKRYEAETGTQNCVEEQELKYMNECDIDLDEFGENGFRTYVCEKACAYDRLMSGGKKTLKEWANFLGMAVAVDRDGAVWAYPYRPVRYCNIWGSDEETWPSGAFEMPENLVDFNGEWKDSLTLPDEWEAM